LKLVDIINNEEKEFLVARAPLRSKGARGILTRPPKAAAAPLGVWTRN